MPRRSFSMSGEYNYPPASNYARADQIVSDILENNLPPSTISPSGELYRRIERYHRLGEESRRQRSNMADPERQQGESSGPPPAMETELEAARRNNRDPLWLARNRPAGFRSRNSVRPPFRSSAPSQYAERVRRANRESRERVDDIEDTAAERDAMARLREALYLSPADVESEDNTEHRRAKRRKIDTGSGENAAFRYGKYGQVEPGKLNMEIVSCDGGIYQEQKGSTYVAENILRNDDTVYCTKSNRCNLVLRHQGGTVFSLKELIIKAPHVGYTAPVQEGMVFVSMSSDDLLTRTAQYQIQYSPPKPRNPPLERMSLPSIHTLLRPTASAMSTAQAGARRLYNIGLRDEDCDYRTAQIPANFTTSFPLFQVTTECSDSEGEDDNTRARRSVVHIRTHIDSDDSDEEDYIAEYLPESSRDHTSRRTSRRSEPRNFTLADAVEASQVATQEAVLAVGGELMVPHARFFIERDKSKCTVKFDPPVSGRFILLKMWSPHHNSSGNIDVQSVVAKGFSGPRFFPEVSFR